MMADSTQDTFKRLNAAREQIVNMINSLEDAKIGVDALFDVLVGRNDARYLDALELETHVAEIVDEYPDFGVTLAQMHDDVCMAYDLLGVDSAGEEVEEEDG